MIKRKIIFTLIAYCLLLCFSCTFAFASYSIEIYKSTNKLYLYQDGNLAKIFPVATGKTSDLTPEGSFTVATKIKNPPYYKSNIPGGSPNNPLGYYWLGISHAGGYTYGIHGTNNPSSIGTHASAGCVRMYNADIEYLYGIIPIGTSVKIQQSQPASLPSQVPTQAVTPVKEEFPLEIPEGLSDDVVSSLKSGMIVPEKNITLP